MANKNISPFYACGNPPVRNIEEAREIYFEVEPQLKEIRDGFIDKLYEDEEMGPIIKNRIDLNVLRILRESMGGFLIPLGLEKPVLEEARNSSKKEDTLLYKIIQLHNSLLDKYLEIVKRVQARYPADFEEMMKKLEPVNSYLKHKI